MPVEKRVLLEDTWETKDKNILSKRSLCNIGHTEVYHVSF